LGRMAVDRNSGYCAIESGPADANGANDAASNATSVRIDVFMIS